MAREIIQKVWCDVCMEADERTEGEEVTVAIGARKPRVLALCETHTKELYRPLVEVLESLGQSADSTAAPKASPAKQPPSDAFDHPTLCLVPGCRSLSGSVKSLRSHTRSVHGLSASAYDSAYAAPISPKHDRLEAAKREQEDIKPGDAETYVCPVGGCDLQLDLTGYKKPAVAIAQHKRSHPDFDYEALAS